MATTFSEPPIDRSRYALLKSAVDALSEVCDGALDKDDRGFDGADTRAGHLYAFLPQDAWPLCVFHRAWFWTKKYHSQLEAMGLGCSQVPEPPVLENEDRQIALQPDGGGYYVVFPNDWDLIEDFRRLPGSAVHKVPIGVSGKLFFRYRTYKGSGDALLAFAKENRFRLGAGVLERARLSGDNRVVFGQASDSFALYFADRQMNEEIRHIPCRSYSYDGGFHWVIAARRNAVGPLRAFLIRHDFVIPPEAEQRLQALEREASRATCIREPG